MPSQGTPGCPCANKGANSARAQFLTDAKKVVQSDDRVVEQVAALDDALKTYVAAINPPKLMLRCVCKDTNHKSKETSGRVCNCDEIDLESKEIITNRQVHTITVE